MNNTIIDNFVKVFKPGDNLTKPDEKILEFGKKKLAEEIIYLWENYGFGEYADGLLKVIDPRDYMNSLYTWLGGIDYNKIPIMVSAFGDIFYYRKLENNENDISILDIHYRKIEVCAWSYQDFFKKYIINNETIKNILREDLYNEAIKVLGNLKYNEIFYFAPALILGGAEDIKYLKKGDANVHHQVLFQMGNKE